MIFYKHRHQFLLKDKQFVGQRLDRVLAIFLPEESRSKILGFIKEGFVKVNGHLTKPAYKVKIGDSVDVEFPPPKISELAPEKIPLKILFEDTDLLIIDKPAGLAVHPPSEREQTGTLVNALLHYLGRRLSRVGGVLRPGIVHRLDKDTSGVLVVAKNDRIHRKLAALFEKREVEKTYLALVNGVLKPGEGIIEASIGRSLQYRKKMAVSHFKGKEAVTKYKVLEYIDGYTLAEVTLLTGRTHQIRVHFASIGFPVVGDNVYGNDKVNAFFEKKFGLKRQFLHAHSIGFTHPITGKKINVKAVLADDLRKVLEELKKVSS